jgi:hypothetical protein
MTDAQRRGLAWLERVLQKVDAEVMNPDYHGRLIIDIEIRGGTIVDIETVKRQKSMKPARTENGFMRTN